MMIKLIALDLDGSLLTDNKQLPPDFYEVAEQIFEKNITLVIASGRPFHNIQSVFTRIKDQLYFVCDNGSFVIHKDEELLVNPLDKDSVNTFINMSRSVPNAFPVLCAKHLAYIEDIDPVFKKQALKYYQAFEIVDDLTSVNDSILKISLCDLVDSETNSYPFYKHFANRYKIAIAGKNWLDITNLTASKGSAIEFIQNKLPLQKRWLLAII